MKNTVNERVKLLRTHLNLSQSDFAYKLEKTGASISRVENNVATPRVSTLNKMVAIFGVSKDWLINGEGELVISPPTSKESSWKQKAFEVMERQNEHLSKEVQFLRGLLTNITGQAQANFNEAFNLVALSDEKSVESVRVAA